MTTDPTLLASNNIDFGEAFDSYPTVFKNFSTWITSPYKVSLDMNADFQIVRQPDSKQLFIFLSLRPRFSIQSPVHTESETYFLDTTSLGAVVSLAPSGGALEVKGFPDTEEQVVDYSYTSGFSINGNITGTLEGSEEKGVSGGGSITIGGGYTSSQTAQMSVKDLHLTTYQSGNIVNWNYEIGNLYKGADAVPYDPNQLPGILDSGAGHLRTPPLVATSTNNAETLLVLRLPDSTETVTLNLRQQARLIHGYITNTWNNVSATWVGRSLQVKINLKEAPPSAQHLPLSMIDEAQLILSLGAAYHSNGDRHRLG